VPPPRAQPLEIADLGNTRATLALDELGNARGGVRTPYVDVPLVRYGVYMKELDFDKRLPLQSSIDTGELSHRMWTIELA
jgi:hypothetical protein